MSKASRWLLCCCESYFIIYKKSVCYCSDVAYCSNRFLYDQKSNSPEWVFVLQYFRKSEWKGFFKADWATQVDQLGYLNQPKCEKGYTCRKKNLLNKMVLKRCFSQSFTRKGVLFFNIGTTESWWFFRVARCTCLPKNSLSPLLTPRVSSHNLYPLGNILRYLI